MAGWYHNVEANPRVTVEVGTRRYDASASVLHGSERDHVYAEMTARNPAFGEYEKNLDRVIPVVALDEVA